MKQNFLTISKSFFLLFLIVFVTTSCKRGTGSGGKKSTQGTSSAEEDSGSGPAQKAGEFFLTYNDISELEGSSLTFKIKGKTLQITPGEGAGCVTLKQADFNSLEIIFTGGTETKSCSNANKKLSVNPRVRKPPKCYEEVLYGHKKITVTGKGAFMGALSGGRYKLSVEDREEAFQPDTTCKKLEETVETK